MTKLNKDAEKLRKSLFYRRINVWDKLQPEHVDAMESYSIEYRQYLDQSKTEREAVAVAQEAIMANGYEELGKSKQKERLFVKHADKALAIFRKGKLDLSAGLNIVVAHVDSPRLDLKQNPLYEDTELVFLKTHYYGGIKKYQWLSRPLAIHGVVILPDGTSKSIIIGEDADDPVFTIADLLPHLAGKAQGNKKAGEFITGEKLNIILGSRPFGNDPDLAERFKLFAAQLLHERYGLREEDFISADLEVVPSGCTREVGLDRSLIAGYGQDDRVCAYAALRSILEAEEIQRSALILLMDKEEIGSEGSTGSNTWFLEMVMGDILDLYGHQDYGTLRRILSTAACLSADVNAAVHPDWAEVHEKRNAAYLNSGLVLSKFTGVRGKASSNEAHAEFLAKLRRIFGDNDIVWHIAELGKVDEGGGGTIAKFMAYYGMDVIDAGVPVLDMHSPFEITAKTDIWMMKKAFMAFLQDYR